MRLEFAEGTVETGPKQAGFKILAEWKPRQQRVVFRKSTLGQLLPPEEVQDLDQRLIEQGEDE